MTDQRITDEGVDNTSPQIHVVPAVGTDEVQHDLDGDCICGPAVEMVETGEGDGWLFTHHSLDNRERFEGGAG